MHVLEESIGGGVFIEQVDELLWNVNVLSKVWIQIVLLEFYKVLNLVVVVLVERLQFNLF